MSEPEIVSSSITIGAGYKERKKNNNNNSGLLTLVAALLCVFIALQNTNIDLEDIDIPALEEFLENEGHENNEEKVNVTQKNEEQLSVMWSLSEDLSTATRTYTDPEGKTSQVQYEFSEEARDWYKKFMENYPDSNQMEINMTIAALSTLNKGIKYSMSSNLRSGPTLDFKNKYFDCSSWYCEVIYLASGIDLEGGRVTGTIIEKGDKNYIKTKEDARPSDAFLKNTQPTGGGNHVVFFLGIFNGKVYVIHCSSENGGVAVSDFSNRYYPIMVRMDFMKEYLNSRNGKKQSALRESNSQGQRTIAWIGDDPRE